MPEGPEIYTSTLIIKKQLENLYLNNIEYTSNFTNSRNLLNTELVDYELPLKIKEIFSRGKRVNFICENSKKEGSVFVWFYSMTGRLCFTHRGKPLIIMTFNPNLITDKNYNETNDIILYYEDSRTLGFVKYAISEEEIEDIYKDVGPDFLNNEVELDYFTTIIKNKRMKTKPIAELLIDQSKISGIGNYLRAEILYEAKISPFRQLQNITDTEIDNLYNIILKTLKESVKLGGLSFNDYLNPNSEKGQFVCQIYGNTHDSEGNIIVKEKIGPVPSPGKKDMRRSIHWVRKVQT